MGSSDQTSLLLSMHRETLKASNLALLLVLGTRLVLRKGGRLSSLDFYSILTKWEGVSSTWDGAITMR
jgi:hypothetical protein